MSDRDLIGEYLVIDDSGDGSKEQFVSSMLLSGRHYHYNTFFEAKENGKGEWIRRENSCQSCGGITLKTCSKCQYVFHCSKFCEERDSPLHKKMCPFLLTNKNETGNILLFKDEETEYIMKHHWEKSYFSSYPQSISLHNSYVLLSLEKNYVGLFRYLLQSSFGLTYVSTEIWTRIFQHQNVDQWFDILLEYQIRCNFSFYEAFIFMPVRFFIWHTEQTKPSNHDIELMIAKEKLPNNPAIIPNLRYLIESKKISQHTIALLSVRFRLLSKFETLRNDFFQMLDQAVRNIQIFPVKMKEIQNALSHKLCLPKEILGIMFSYYPFDYFG